MKEIKLKDLNNQVKKFKKNKMATVMGNVLSKNNLRESIHVQNRLAETNHNFEIDIKTLKATHQYATGRCWIFAGTNVLREVVAKKCNLDEFELSQNYLAFYDKYEKVNYLLEAIIELKDKDSEDRTLSFLLNQGIQDGGQWDMFVNVVKKYGLMPKSAFPETYQSNNSREMNFVINTSIRKFAARVRKLVNEKQEDKIENEKRELLENIFEFLCSCYGTPKEEFDFEYVDKDKKYHLVQNLNPIKFYNEYVGDILDDYVSVINAPTEDKPFHELYTVKYTNNVVGGKDILYLNLPMDEFKELCVKQLKDKEVVWFGSDCGKYGDAKTGVWDAEAYDYINTIGIDLDMTKANMLDFKQSAMNHAMVITGVSFKNSKPTKYKVENSWGETRGNKGYYLMADNWFDRYVFQAVINKKNLSKKQKELLNKQVKVLNPWDPMGTLA